MNKKIVSLFTLIVFTVLTFSCYSTKVGTIEQVTSRERNEVRILKVITTSGERIKFSKKVPGRIVGNKIVGVVNEAGRKKAVSIPLSNVESVKVEVKKAGAKQIAALVGGGVIILFITSFSRWRKRGF